MSLVLRVMVITLGLTRMTSSEGVAGTLAVRVPAGDAAVLTCSLQAAGLIIWDREGVTGAIALNGVVQAGRGGRYSVTSDGGSQTLSIGAVQLDDSDIYRCYPFSNTNHVIKTNLTVLVRPEALLVQVVTDPVEEGRPLRVRCTAHASRPPAQLSWTVTETTMDPYELRGTVTDQWHSNGTTSRTSEVYLPATREMYGALFVCVGRQEELGYSQGAQVTLNMNVGPLQTQLVPPQESVVEGVRTFLTCTARDARPPASVSWYWENDPVNGDVSTRRHNNGTCDVTSKLWVEPTEQYNGVHFVCDVSHPVLEAAGTPSYRMTYTLNVMYKPRVSVRETRLNAWEGSPFSVTCSFYANPNVTDVTWYKNGVIVSPTNRTTMTMNGGEASLTVGDPTKDDTAEYRCTAKNSVGVAQSEVVNVIVMHSPLCDANQKFQYGTPVGHRVSLVCRVEALPSELVFFGWSINGSDWIISEGSRDPRVPTAAISVFNVTVMSEEDYGEVACKAYNGVNEMSEPCTYQIRRPGPAEAPTLCKVSDESDTSAAIDCLDAYDGGSPASYWLQWRDVDSDVYMTAANLTDYDFRVSGLQSGKLYQMRVCAANAIYWGNISCTPDFMVSTKGLPIPGSIASYSSGSTNFIIGGAVGAICLICIVAIIVEITILRKRDQKRMKEDMELYSRVDPDHALQTPEMCERYPPPSPGTEHRRSQKVTNIDHVMSSSPVTSTAPDPLYDSADGLKGTLSAERVRAIIRQGERESIIESGLPESSIEPEVVAESVSTKVLDVGGVSTEIGTGANNPGYVGEGTVPPEIVGVRT